jgi:predicted transcriptional regulator
VLSLRHDRIPNRSTRTPTRQALAARAGTARAGAAVTVARIELGVLSPRVDTLERVLRAAGQSLTTEPLLGIGIDRTQIRELLRLTPEQRLRLAESGARALAAFDAAVGR